MTGHACSANNLPVLAQHTGWGRVPGWAAKNGTVYACPACGKLWKVKVHDTGYRVVRGWHPVKPLDLLAKLRALR